MNQENEVQRKAQIAGKLNELKKKAQTEVVERILAFNKTPREVKSYMDQYVIGQELGKKVLSVGIAFHYRRLAHTMKDEIDNNGGDIEKALKNGRFIKKNIMIIGPTGCGKTYSLEKLSEFVNVPLVIEDMTKFSSTGYVGRDLEELSADLLAKSEGNPYLAQMGIIFLDEIDKIIAAKYGLGKDVNGLEVQNGLLKIVEGAEVPLPRHLGNGLFSTRYNLFVASGAFEGLKESVEKRIRALNNGNAHWSKLLTNYDLMNYGIERQLLSRFPIKVVYDELCQTDMVEIMKRGGDSPLKTYERDLDAWGIKLKIAPAALKEIAGHSADQGIGARGLITTIEKVLLDAMYDMPGSYNGVLSVDKKYVMEKLGGNNANKR